MSYKTGPAANGQGNLTTAGCVSCHGPNNTNTKVNLGLIDATTSVPVTDGKYVPGKTYTIVELGSNTSASQSHFGFQVVSVNGSGSQAGSFGIVNATNTQPFSAGGLNGAEHKAPIAKSGNVFNPDIHWTAPVAGTGTVTFRIAVNAVNNDNSSAGDQPNVGTATLTEKTASSVNTLEATRFRLFPNPAAGNMTLDMSKAPEGAYAVKAFDMSGKVLLNRQLQVSGGSKSFDLSTASLPAGLYHLLISGKDGQQALKFVKQ